MNDEFNKSDLDGRRQGDSGLGIPNFEPLNKRELNEKETEEHRLKVEEELRVKANEILSDIEQEDGFRLPVSLRRFCSVVLLVVSAFMGMFLVTEIVRFLSGLKALPLWGQWLASICLIIFGGIIVVLLCSILISIIRLQRSPQISMKAAKILSQRKHMQMVALEKHDEAKIILEKYLKHYSLSGKKRRQLLAMGMTENELKALADGKEKLIHNFNRQPSEDWVEDFDKYFQAVLDGFSKRKVKQYATRVGIGTATSPIAMIDRGIVLYGCMSMIKDLLVIYNLRPAFGQSILIFSRSVIYTYMSGFVENATEAAVESVMDSVQEFTGDSINVLMGSVGRFVGAKGAEATLNGALIWRLGKKSISLLQPVR